MSAGAAIAAPSALARARATVATAVALSGPFFSRLTGPRARAAAAPARSLVSARARTRTTSRAAKAEATGEDKDGDDAEVIGTVFLEEAARVSRRRIADEAEAFAARLRAGADAAAADAAAAAAARAAAASMGGLDLAVTDPALDRSWIGSDHETAFLSVDSFARGVNYGQLAQPIVAGSASGMTETVGGGMLAQNTYQIAAQTGPALDTGLEDAVVRDLVAACVQPINTVFPYSVTAVMQGRLPQLIAEATAQAVVQRVTHPITREVTRRIQRTLARTLPETNEAQAAANIMAGSGSDLLHTLVLSVPTTIIPALAYTLVHDPRVDYYCYYCLKQHVYCLYCNDHREKAGRQVYYAQYYGDYYARHYGLYFKDYFVKEELERLTGPGSRNRRMQDLANMHWDTRNILVVEDAPGPYMPPVLRLRGEKPVEEIPNPTYIKITKDSREPVEQPDGVVPTGKAGDPPEE
jgi:hypothetical protein